MTRKIISGIFWLLLVPIAVCLSTWGQLLFFIWIAGSLLAVLTIGACELLGLRCAERMGFK